MAGDEAEGSRLCSRATGVANYQAKQESFGNAKKEPRGEFGWQPGHHPDLHLLCFPFFRCLY
jgi:hypothetical protein